MRESLLDAVATPLGTVQSLLGHSSSAITRDVYLHSIPSDARAAVQKVEDLLIRCSKVHEQFAPLPLAASL